MASVEATIGSGAVNLNGAQLVVNGARSVLALDNTDDRPSIGGVTIDESNIGYSNLSFALEARIQFDNANKNQFIFDKRQTWSGFSIERRLNGRFRVRLGSGKNQQRVTQYENGCSAPE